MFLSADTMNIFSSAKQIKFTIRSEVATDAPVETSKLVLTTHYDVSVRSRLAKNI